MLRSPTALVMMDSRSPVATVHAGMRSHLSFAFELNRAYACAHGYALIFYQMSGNSCTHATLGERHPSYCKLAAVGDALVRRQFATVVFLDSDAFIQHIDRPLPSLLKAARGAGAADVRDPAVFFAWDQPYSFGPNGGVHVWRDSTAARALLSTWWHIDGEAYHQIHDFEQHALQWRLVHLERSRGVLETLQIRALDTGSPLAPTSYADAVVHLDHTRETLRPWMMGLALVEAHLQPAGPGSRGSLHSLLLESKRSLRRSANWRLRERVIRTALEVVANASREGDSNACSATATVVADWDASVAAAAAIQPPSLASVLPGMALSLTTCGGRRSSGWQSWSWCHPDEQRGLELQLEDDRPARHDGAAARFRGESKIHSRFCLRIGPALAPKPAHHPLAQLERCGDNITGETGATAVAYRRTTGRLSSRGVVANVLPAAAPAVRTALHRLSEEHNGAGAAAVLEQKVHHLLKGRDALWPNATGDRTLWPGRALDSEDDAGAARRTAHHKESAGTVPQTPGLARWFSAPLCLMPWSAKVAAVNADAGAPLVFGECRQRRAHHQHWVKEAISGSESEGQFRLRLADTKLCMSAPRVAFA